MTSSWFFLSTLNYDARSTTHQNLHRSSAKLLKANLVLNKDTEHISKLHILARMNNFVQKHKREGNRESEPPANAGAMMVVVVHKRGTLCRMYFVGG